MYMYNGSPRKKKHHAKNVAFLRARRPQIPGHPFLFTVTFSFFGLLALQRQNALQCQVLHPWGARIIGPPDGHGVQECLAHKKRPPPRTLQKDYLGPLFLMSKVLHPCIPNFEQALYM